MTLPDSLRAQTVLADLQTIVALAENDTGLRVVSVTVDLLAVTSRSGGAGVPEPVTKLVPKDFLTGDMTRADTQRLTFVLKRRGAAPHFDALPAHLKEATRIVRTGLQALAGLEASFEASAKIEFRFELTSEGKFNFILKVGAKSVDTHTVTLEVTPTA
ncbi:hypothetical protein DAERI_020038 [Deinococcus aerius]|uniref:Uncharacterized protein n=2 Tax=Deinococcus TaxID=1298 RepID=A0A2I9DI99_9DEIO|nr:MULTISPECIES: hypothetical protein [Deinococcus]MBB5293681.1 hypothetical protein [Deinococcus metallilatus]QBY07347.1 hypothetical protein E5F05_05055 [Deinococcus metallilatus]RXJ14820.1 hypothetical protein ERJ73_03775 [Deinococcus metallilatus]TLK30941.1 hypothetical protein FCS05_04090 [Deinococcus metallilatus]GBF04441.1 hypothetical protein DAERI_020038 [Deinococcus aerius]